MTMTFQAVYENGVFRPTEKLNLPDHCQVAVEIHQIQLGSEKPDLNDIYDLLSARFNSGESDVAARHNEHQP